MPLSSSSSRFGLLLKKAVNFFLISLIAGRSDPVCTLGSLSESPPLCFLLFMCLFGSVVNCVRSSPNNNNNKRAYALIPIERNASFKKTRSVPSTFLVSSFFLILQSNKEIIINVIYYF